jgi:hypothetical protein
MADAITRNFLFFAPHDAVAFAVIGTMGAKPGKTDPGVSKLGLAKLNVSAQTEAVQFQSTISHR